MNKHFKNLTFPKLFFIWFALFFLLLMINNITLKSNLLTSLSGAALGVFLLFPPAPFSAVTARSRPLWSPA